MPLAKRWAQPHLLALCAVLMMPPNRAPAAHTLNEPVPDRRCFQVTSRLTVNGQLKTAVGDGKAQALDLKVEASHGYRQRSLPAAGRDAEALRGLRQYETATAQISVNSQSHVSRLRNDRRRLIAQGRREGVTFYSRSGPLTYDELELLQSPGDPLAALALLPPKPVDVGESWPAPDWAVQMLTGLEAVLKSQMTCQLVSVDAGVAHVTFQGRIEGAALGAATTVEVSGSYRFDLDRRCLTQFTLKQKEQRSVGAVTPGMDVVAEVEWNRRPIEDPGPLTDAVVSAIPLRLETASLKLQFETPWGVRLLHGRHWHVFHQSDKVGVLRLIDKGQLIAQCNVSKIPDADPGQHTPVEQFLQDIHESLGDRLKSIESAEPIPTDDGRFLYRVTAAGEANGRPMHWIYYLCAGPSGRQTAFVFAVETELLKQLGAGDREIVRSLEFVDPSR